MLVTAQGRSYKRANISKSVDLASSILYPFMHSRLVVTNTFHGCVMALMVVAHLLLW